MFLSFLFPFFCLFGDVAFSDFFLYHFRFLFVWRVRRTFFPSGWCFFYLVTTGRIFDISLCENLINQKNYRLCRAFGEEALCNLLLGDSRAKRTFYYTSLHRGIPLDVQNISTHKYCSRGLNIRSYKIYTPIKTIDFVGLSENRRFACCMQLTFRGFEGEKYTFYYTPLHRGIPLGVQKYIHP